MAHLSQLEAQELGDGLLPATALSLSRRPVAVTPDDLRSSPTLPGQSPSLGI